MTLSPIGIKVLAGIPGIPGSPVVGVPKGIRALHFVGAEREQGITNDGQMKKIPTMLQLHLHSPPTRLADERLLVKLFVVERLQYQYDAAKKLQSLLLPKQSIRHVYLLYLISNGSFFFSFKV